MDNSLTYFIGENLVFDLILNDIYENKLNKEVNAKIFASFKAKFKYGPPSKTSSTAASPSNQNGEEPYADLDFEKIQ